MTVTYADIENAAERLKGAVVRTPTVPAPDLSDLCDARLSLKLESLQPTGSFKVRGALIRLLALSPGERGDGVVAASAGNHAQGVAYHAARLGIPATIVMPKGTPFTKVGRTERLGAAVIVDGDGFAGAAAIAHDIAEERGLTYIHPYDDPDIIAGQGTIGIEMLADRPDLDVIVVPVGGGGLIAGIATAVKHLRPEVEVIGVETALYPWAAHALAGHAAPPPGGRTVAEGIAVKTPGRLTLPIIERLVADVIVVEEEEIEQAVYTLLTRQNLVVEGAGAAPLAAVAANRERFAGRTVGLVLSGGNIDARLLSSILLRGLARDGRVARLRIELDDAPGTLALAADAIGKGGGNIIEIHHRRLFHDVPVKLTEVDAVVETLDARHVDEIVARLRASGFPTRRLGATAETDPG